MKHNWKKNEDGSVDEFAFNRDGHNGVFCEDCGKSSCVHCDGYSYDDMDDCTGIPIRTVASVLLDRWANDTEAMALEFVYYKNIYGFKTFFARHVDGSFDSATEAANAELAYLNSAAEVAK